MSLPRSICLMDKNFKTTSGVDNDLEDLMSHLGDFGKYQLYQYLLLSLGAIATGLHMLTSVTVAAIPNHRCAVPDVEVNGTHLEWSSTEVLSRIPRTKDIFSSCEIYNEYKNGTHKCNSWVYDHTYYKSSRGIEWNMVCDRRWMGALSQLLFMLGGFTGAIVFGTLADRYGRKPIFCYSGLGQLIMGTLVAFAPNYTAYAILSYMYGIFGYAGTYVNACVLAMEIIGPSKRTAYGAALLGGFALGECLVAFWGWLIKDQTWLQLIYGLHGLLLVCHWWWLDESPRWLWAQGRKKEAVDIVEKGMKINDPDATFDETRFLSRVQKLKAEEEPKEKVHVLDLFKTPQLRRRTLITCYNWSAITLGFYGLSLGTNKMEGNPYIALSIMAIVEIPSAVVVMVFMDKIGRRSINMIFLFFGSISMLTAATLPKDSEFLSQCITGVIYFGKFCVTGSITVIYNYTAEIYPTVLRNSGVGLSAMCGKFSAALTPLIGLLDSYDERVPMLVFAVLLMISGFLSMLLPETMDQPMPQTVQDGENFLVGDTCCTTGCYTTGRRKQPVPMEEL